MAELAIETHALVKRFKKTVAVDGIDLAIPRGGVHGFLGPNGAGKTTTIRMLATLTKPDSGTARVLGRDIVTEANEVRRRVSLTGQFASVDEDLTGAENLRLIGRLFGYTGARATRRADELLSAFGLSDARDKQVKKYSGGMRRRIDIAASIVVTPELLFLDEPTTGLDPRSRNDLWDVLRSLVADGTTLLLTTQYLEEADQLADEIVVIDRGRIIAKGTPLQLKEQGGNASLVVTVSRAADLVSARELLTRTGSEVHVDEGARRLTASADGIADLTTVANWLQESHIEVDDIGLSRPSLDDVFLSLTGHRADDEEVSA